MPLIYDLQLRDDWLLFKEKPACRENRQNFGKILQIILLLIIIIIELIQLENNLYLPGIDEISTVDSYKRIN